MNACICHVSNNMGKPIIITNPMVTNHEETVNRFMLLEVIFLMKCTHYLKDEELKLTCDITENVYCPLLKTLITIFHKDSGQ